LLTLLKIYPFSHLDAKNEKNWNWAMLSYNPNIPIEFIQQNRDWPWYWILVSRNRNFDVNHIPFLWDMYQKHKDTLFCDTLAEIIIIPSTSFSDTYMHYTNLPKKEDFDPIAIGYKNHCAIDIAFLSMTATWNEIQTHTEINWNHDYMSINPNLSFENIMSLQTLNWDMLSRNPIITTDIIEANLDWPWNFQCFSCNPNITI
jgi:hypothetical protein